ncbi:transmembrane alpha-helix domain-containing [Cordyceps militaris]|uniref:Transmembrane alpha-helix domain-containing n=1 Tax=Cordyceps militaris TaxID=73501 RepID=A0A2H4SQI5_CORMI|nr:transmembrane alpha-helix domain-containing [Cordyceps militaris]
METFFTTAATRTTATATAHDGTAPAAALPTPFDFPCGVDFLSNEFHRNKQLRDRCGPPGFEDYWWSAVGYYSPAVCPRGYTAGCFRWNADQGPAVEPTETAVQCVPRPRGYKCKKDDVSLAFSGTATAPMIQIRWASTDLPALATHPLYPGANPTNTEEDYLMKRTRGARLRGRAESSGYYPYDSGGGGPPGSTTAGSGGASSTGSGSDSSGGGGFRLSTGAKVGIGLGVAFSALVGFALLGLILWRIRVSSKRAKQQHTTQQPHMVPSRYATQPGPGPPMAGGPMSSPLQPAPVYQQPGTSELGHSASAANSQWATASSVTPPPAAATSSVAGPPSELPGGRTPNNPPVEMDSGSPAQQQPVAELPAAAAPRRPFVGATPALSSLREQHALLEQRRQRILELERIEQEQEALENRMSQAEAQGEK